MYLGRKNRPNMALQVEHTVGFLFFWDVLFGGDGHPILKSLWWVSTPHWRGDISIFYSIIFSNIFSWLQVCGLNTTNYICRGIYICSIKTRDETPGMVRTFIGFLNNCLLEGSSQLPHKQWDLWAIHVFWRQVILTHQSLYNKHHSQNKIDLATLPHKLKQYKTLEVWANILGIWEDLYRYLENYSCSMKLTAGSIWSLFSTSNMVQLNRGKSFDNLRRPYTPGFPPKTVSGGTMVSGGKISAVHTSGGS